MEEVIAVACGGALGALTRFFVGKIAPISTSIPYSTLAVNLLGSLILGISYALTKESKIISPQFFLFIATGFCGALTTMSTFAWQSLDLLDKQPLMALVNVFLNLLGSFFAVTMGYWGALRLVK